MLTAPALSDFFRDIFNELKIYFSVKIHRKLCIDAFRIKNQSIQNFLNKVMPNFLPKGQIWQNSILSEH